MCGQGSNSADTQVKKGSGFLYFFFLFPICRLWEDGPPMAEPNAFDGVCPIFDSYCVIWCLSTHSSPCERWTDWEYYSWKNENEGQADSQTVRHTVFMDIPSNIGRTFRNEYNQRYYIRIELRGRLERQASSRGQKLFWVFTAVTQIKRKKRRKKQEVRKHFSLIICRYIAALKKKKKNTYYWWWLVP